METLNITNSFMTEIIRKNENNSVILNVINNMPLTIDHLGRLDVVKLQKKELSLLLNYSEEEFFENYFSELKEEEDEEIYYNPHDEDDDSPYSFWHIYGVCIDAENNIVYHKMDWHPIGELMFKKKFTPEYILLVGGLYNHPSYKAKIIKFNKNVLDNFIKKNFSQARKILKKLPKK